MSSDSDKRVSDLLDEMQKAYEPPHVPTAVKIDKPIIDKPIEALPNQLYKSPWVSGTTNDDKTPWWHTAIGGAFLILIVVSAYTGCCDPGESYHPIVSPPAANF